MHKIFDFNHDWQYFGEVHDGILTKEFSLEGECVDMPHCPSGDTPSYSGRSRTETYYRKYFKIDNDLASMRLFLDFDGADNEVTVYVNGKKLAINEGGCLPFEVDITDDVRMNENNLIVLKVDRCTMGGMCAGVRLRAVDKLYIDSNIASPKGGIFVYTEKIADGTAHIAVDVGVVNRYFKQLRVMVKTVLLDKFGGRVAEAESRPICVMDNTSMVFSNKMALTSPLLWSEKTPNLYTLRCEVYANDELADAVDTIVGIRTVEVTRDRFLLNGNIVTLNLANIDKIEGEKSCTEYLARLKDMGHNIVRIVGYPFMDKIMDVCDRLGIMAVVTTPYVYRCGKGRAKRLAQSGMALMVRQNRNHPSAVIWDVSLGNLASDGIYRKRVEAIRGEFAPYNVLVAGDIVGRRHWDRLGYDIPFVETDGDRVAYETTSHYTLDIREVKMLEGKESIQNISVTIDTDEADIL